MDILICDDDIEFLKKLTSLLTDELKKYSVNYKITCFSSGKEIINQMEVLESDVLFLDIDMPEITGFQIAEKVEKLSALPIIVFVSNKDHLVFESFAYNPFWFLRKSDMEQLSRVVEKMVNIYINKKQTFDFEVNKKHFSFRLEDIQYFESDNHYITIYTADESYKYKASISEITRKLEKHHFVRTHVGFLVNCKYISQIKNNDIYLMSGKCIPISRNRKKDVHKAFFAYTRSIHI